MTNNKIENLMLEASKVVLEQQTEIGMLKERLEETRQLYINQLAINGQQELKINKMIDDIVSLTDDLFAERRECIKFEDEIKDLKEQLLNEQWKNADADI